MTDAALLNAALRTHFELFLQRSFLTLNPNRTFFGNWHLEAIAYELERIRLGQNTRLIINLPPRSLKSLVASIAFPAFVLGHDPSKRIFSISYGTALADSHSSAFRSLVEAGWYKRAFPGMHIERSLEDQVITTARGYRRSTTVMGALTGLGGDIFILDDPQKAVDALSETKRNSLNEWFSNTLLSRLDNKRTGAIVLVTQRVHMNDLCGFLTDSSDDWTVLSLSAIADDEERIRIGDDDFYHRAAGEVLHAAREPLEALEQLKRDMGAYDFVAQYQQHPVPRGGALIKREWLRYYRPEQLPDDLYPARVI